MSRYAEGAQAAAEACARVGMDVALQERCDRLVERLRDKERVAVAFSGGVDSALLLVCAHEALGDSVLALTAVSPFFPQAEAQAARAFCETRGIRQVAVPFRPLDDAAIAANDPLRCYRCKRALMELLQQEAQKAGAVLVEGSNASDELMRRPGAAALAELGVASPLADAGLTKADVRTAARALGLAMWDKPSLACLATRFPYGERITEEGLRAVDAAEQMLQVEGFTQVRVRVHGDVARIEVLPEELPALLDEARRQRIDQVVRAAGFSYVSADLQGYRCGSADEVLEER